MKQRDRTRRFEALRALGCICCLLNLLMVPPLFQTGMSTEVHHQNAGGYAGQARLGDEITIPLCCWHHRGVLRPQWRLARMEEVYGPSLQRTSKKFRAFYGTDQVLLEDVNKRIEKILRRAA